jgi:signal transduction histidine kinase
MVDRAVLEASLQADIDAVSRIDAIPTILEVVCRTTGMRFAAVARVTEDRWIACSVRDDIQFGLAPGGELQIESTICNEIRQHGTAVVIDHVTEDPLYCRHGTPARYGFQSYLSMPIVLVGGKFFGTLCALDPKPARVNTPETIGMFKLFADLIAFHLDGQQRLAASEASLLSERASAELREQFIAVLGHDLRNPLASIASGGRILLQTPLNEKATSIVALMQASVKRMAGLIDNVLDFARGRLGGGLVLNRNRDESLQPTLEQVINELQTTWPDRIIEFSADLTEPVSCDRSRIAQLLSNLISNALTHGAADAPVKVRAFTIAGMLEVSVVNAGEPIAALMLDKLFQPFVRASAQSSLQGLGLGLYIASEIARAHGGTLTATSTADVTRFTFRMSCVEQRRKVSGE